MNCTVYRLGRHDGTYLYLREGLDANCLPPQLQQRAASMHRVMDLALDSGRKLARVETRQVIAALEARGWYLQLPPNGDVAVDLHYGD